MHKIDSRPSRRLQAVRLAGGSALLEAQALRFAVFSDELEARLEGAESGLDADEFDAHCTHIGVRDLDSGCLVATTRAGSPGRPPPRAFLQ